MNKNEIVDPSLEKKQKKKRCQNQINLPSEVIFRRFNIRLLVMETVPVKYRRVFHANACYYSVCHYANAVDGGCICRDYPEAAGLCAVAGDVDN